MGGRDSLCSAKGALALVSALAFLMTVAAPAAAYSAVEEEVTFVASVPELGMTLTLTAQVEHSEQARVEVGEQVDIVYALEPTGGEITLVVPLSDLSFGLIDDYTVEIPVPVSPLGSASFNVLSLVPQIPFGLATLDLVVEGEVQSASCSCTMGTITVQTATSEVQWQDSGERTISVTSSSLPEVSKVRTSLVYALSVGLKATILGADIWILDPVAVSSTNGLPALETTIETYEPASVSALVIGVGVAAAVVAAVVLLLFVRSRHI